MEKLEIYLSQIPPGKIKNTTYLETLLAKAWKELEGDFGGLEGYKIINRMEKVLWNPPKLSFTIERHGGTVLGSTQAELQVWTVDIIEKSATCQIVGYRQLEERQPRLDVNPIADGIASLILNRKKDDRLKWYDENKVKVNIGKILPEGSAVKQTLANRRKGFRKALSEKLISHGWEEINFNVYKFH